MKKQYVGGGLLLIGALSGGAAQAVPLLDTYIGARDYGYGDVIGRKDLFDTTSADVRRGNGKLDVDIFTNFVGNVGVYPSSTLNGQGIGYGDLLLGGKWNPFVKAGDTSADNLIGHKFDDASNGTTWRYGLSFDDRWSTANSGTFTLYELTGTNQQDLLLTDSFFASNITVRRGQAVAVNRNATNFVHVLDTGTWTIDPALKKLSFDLSLANAGELGTWEYLSLHWGMLCNNDAIEGGVSVPEPGTLALFGLGLCGLLVRRATRLK